jgi:HK97 family phage major capsid protein
MSDAVNEISKSLDSLEESIKNVQEEQKNGKVSLKAFEDKVKELGDKQLELSKSLADVTQALDKNTKALNATNEVKSLGQKVAAHEAIKNYQGGTATFKISTKADTINKSPAANSITRNTITPAYQAGMVTMPDHPLQIEQLIPHIPVSVDAIEYTKEGSVTDGSKIVAEGEKLGETTVTNPTLHTANCVNIGAYTVVTHQLLTNESALAAFIETKMQYKLKLNIENQLVNGNGTSTQLGGLLHEGNFTDKTTAVQGKLPKSGATLLDFALLLKTEFEKQYIVPERLLLNPDDWTQLALLKDANGHYILGGPQLLATKNLWGLPVMTTPFVAAGKYILGNFTLGATIYDREALDFRISDSDGENFKSMLYTFRVNRRLGFAVENPLAIFAGDWSLPS